MWCQITYSVQSSNAQIPDPCILSTLWTSPLYLPMSDAIKIKLLIAIATQAIYNILVIFSDDSDHMHRWICMCSFNPHLTKLIFVTQLTKGGGWWLPPPSDLQNESLYDALGTNG